MATLPRHPPSWTQQRASPAEESASAEQEHEHEQEQEHPPRANSLSAASIDSQTVLLNSPPTECDKPAEIAQENASGQTVSPPAEDNEPRRCWICFTDETEDDENTSEWRSPCPCVLVAHEKCLLDWIADMEAPNARRRAGQSAGKILCPQCKSEIRLQRPQSAVVHAVRAMERLTKMCVLPSIGAAIGTATYTTLLAVGRMTITETFGHPEADRLLRTVMPPADTVGHNPWAWTWRVLRLNWRSMFGVPAIPLVLILSRTRLADSFLPFIPLIFLTGTEGLQSDALVRLQWPPSPAFTVATLPYVRSLYNLYYDRVWAPHERRWLKEVQPRAPTTDEVDADIQGGGDAEAILGAIAEEDVDDDGDDVVELEVDVDLLLDWNAGGPADNNDAPENPPVPIARGPARPLNAPPLDDEAPAAAQVNEHDNAAPAPAPNVPLQPAQPRRARVRRERNAAFSTTGIIETIMGAIFLPGVAARTGELLQLVLPASWTTPPATGKATGFLQNRWARSILGGCLVVGLKDAVMLYVRWRMAQSHRQRKVLDYDQSKGKKKRVA